MQETILAVQANVEPERSEAAVSLFDLPVAKLQIAQESDILQDQRSAAPCWSHSSPATRMDCGC